MVLELCINLNNKVSDVKQNKKNIPKCVGVIMDGNRRWAKEKGMPASFGHRAGYKKSKEVILWAKELGVRNIIAYTFSTENWKRNEKEIDMLMKLFVQALSNADFFKKEDIKVTIIGQKERFSEDIIKGINKIEKTTKECKSVHLVVALSYGGRAEIVSAVNKLLNGDLKKVSEEGFANALWTANIPDPDIVVRTGGEKRLSNFLPWQSVYSELFFTDTYWPAFTKKEFKDILAKYDEREKRTGK